MARVMLNDHSSIIVNSINLCLPTDFDVAPSEKATAVQTCGESYVTASVAAVGQKPR